MILYLSLIARSNGPVCMQASPAPLVPAAPSVVWLLHAISTCMKNPVTICTTLHFLNHITHSKVSMCRTRPDQPAKRNLERVRACVEPPPPSPQANVTTCRSSFPVRPFRFVFVSSCPAGGEKANIARETKGKGKGADQRDQARPDPGTVSVITP